MTTWINFRDLRRQLDFATILKHYGVELKVKGEQASGLCPLPSHPQHDGKRRTPSFSVNLARGIWQCFGCGNKGNVIEFAAYMEKLNPSNPGDFRRAALLLQERFGVTSDDKVSSKAVHKANTNPTRANRGDTETQSPTKSGQAVRINTPLDFQLKGLVSNHPYLAERGFNPKTIAHFGLGYCVRGLMARRIAIPLHDQGGALIGYAGRLVDEAAIDTDHPKYRFPGDREHGGIVHQFRKSLFLYHGHASGRPGKDLIMVEGFPATWWLWQSGYTNVVGLMGSSCSEEQAAILVRLADPASRVWLLPDGDDAGERCAADVLAKVAPHRFIRWVKLDAGEQPTDCPLEKLVELLGPPS